MIATANGSATPAHRCDAVIHVRTSAGASRPLELKGALLIPDNQYNLISLGSLARTQGVVTHIAAGSGSSHMSFPDGARVDLVNTGVLVIPDARAPMCMAARGVVPAAVVHDLCFRRPCSRRWPQEQRTPA